MENSTDPARTGWLYERVDGASLAVFRVLVGALLLVYLGTELWSSVPGMVAAKNHFKYPGFEWVGMLPDRWMLWHYAGLCVLAACITVGLFYRVASALLALGYAYAFLVDAGYYSTSIYWMVLASTLMVLLPAQRVWSLDARFYGRTNESSVPRWAVVAPMVFTAIPLLYMGFSRLSEDWLAGYPLMMWFKTASAKHVLGEGFGSFMRMEWTALGWSWFAVFVHLATIPLLLWQRTRWLGLVLFGIYYVGLSLFFQRFILPMPAVAGFVMFFSPDWPRRLLAAVARVPFEPRQAIQATPAQGERAALVALALFLAFHLLFPARAWMHPGVSAWTGDGYRFSWRTMLDDKYCELKFKVRDPETGKEFNVFPGDFLTSAQVQEMKVRPDLMIQFARMAAERSSLARKIAEPEVRVRAKCSLNSRPYGPLVDHNLDLTKQEVSAFGATDWITPATLHMHRGWRIVGPGR